MPKQNVTVDLYYDGAWHNLVANDDVLAEQPIVITRGDGEESAATRPSSITLRLANDDDMYRTSNPMSPLYGKAGVNTPLRVTVGGVTRGVGEVASWQAGQSRDFRPIPRRGKAWVDVEAAGLSQRVNQWTEPIESTMVKGMKSFTTDLIGIWPLEDESTSTILSQIVPGGFSGVITGDVTLGADERPAGSARSVKLGAGGQISGSFIRSSTSGWQISFAMRLPALPGSATYEEIFTWFDSVGRRWTWEVNNANFGWSVYAADGTVLESLASSYSGYEPNQWVRFRVKTTVSGSTVTYEPAWYVEGSVSPAGASGTFTGTSTGRLTQWVATAHTYNDGAWYTGVFAINDSSALLFNAGVLSDFNGHAGETAGNRFVRIMADLGLLAATNGDLDASTPMGGQPADTLPNILKEIRDTDDAVLFESKTAINMVLTCRNFRYNLTPEITLNAADPTRSGLPALPVEVTDDLGIHNVVTASQRAGGSFTVEDSTSVMGTQPPPNGRGEYRQTVDVNVASEVNDLPQQAYWWLNRGTVNLPRFPQVTVNLAAMDPARIAEIEDVTIGSVIEITNYREYTIRLHVIGYTETIGTHSRMITFTCAPDQVFQVGEWDATGSLWDLKSCTMGETAGPTATTLTLALSDVEQWSTAGGYDLLISGELVGVPAGGMGAVTGTGPWQQVITGAVRSKNGIRKTLTTGDQVHVATPGRWAL